MTFAVSRSGSLDALLTPLLRMESGAAIQAGCYALNHTVAKAKTQVGRALVPQTGLKYGAVGKDLRQVSASPSRPEAILNATGAYHRLSEFGARRGAGGVSASPWAVGRTFPRTFFVGAYSGGVFRRQGPDRFPLKQLWGPAVPKEMPQGSSLAAWDRVLATELPVRIAHEWARLMGG
ncbi:hypothetical protein [Xanthobacter sediminis]